MAISNMQQAQQLRANGGIMTIPRQKYGLGKLVKKAVRGIKKVAKSPIGKAALLYAGTAGLGALGAGASGTGFTKAMFSPGNVLSNMKFGLGRLGLGSKMIGPPKPGSSIFSKLNPFTNPKLSFGQKALIGGGLAATALPFFMGGGEEEEEITDTFEVTPSTITDIVSQAKARAPNLRFLPQNAYTQSGFFNAAGGGLADIPRGGYAMGGPTDDVMVENIDTQEVVSNPDPMAELNMLSIELFGKPLNDLNETERGQLQELIQSRMQEQAGDRVMANSALYQFL